jgi:hypothetical protein
MKKTYKEVIEETVEYYSKNPRGFNGEGCDYRSANGAMCAVGRVLKPEVLDKVADYQGNSSELFNNWENAENDDYGIVTNFENIIEEMMQEEYSELTNVAFWDDLQYLHDNSNYWKEIEEGNLLTERGQNYKENLIKKYGN